MIFLILMIVAFSVSFALVWVLRRYALARSLIDIPNVRSSHTVPTPRGGGVAIVLAFLFLIVFLYQTGAIELNLMIALFGATGSVALLGFLDDHGHIAARWRLFGHFFAAIWALIWLGGAPPLAVFGTNVDLGWFGHGLAAVYLVWLLNLYNFMDGIDGLASIEAITVCAGGALLYVLAGDTSHGDLLLLLAAAVAGFLCWNFPPARIFMGDAGSGFLGMTLGVFSIQAAWFSASFFWAWLILLGVFIVDATWTLCRRLIRGDKVYEAHRSHAYQYASRHHGSHKTVTLAVLVLNLFWLLPIALAVALGVLDGLAGLVVAYLPLVLLAVKYNAGTQEPKKVSPIIDGSLR